MNAKILIVDDEANVRLMYRSSLESAGYEIHEADSGAKALEECMARRHDVAILDLRMPGGMDGLELLRKMQELNINTPAVFITAFADVPNAVNAMKLGAIDFLQKPILPDQLREIVKDILVRHEPEDRPAEKRDYEYYLRCAKRAINLRDFTAANKHLVKALDIDPRSRQAINLVGVMLEMRQEHEHGAPARENEPTPVAREIQPAQKQP